MKTRLGCAHYFIAILLLLLFEHAYAQGGGKLREVRNVEVTRNRLFESRIDKNTREALQEEFTKRFGFNDDKYRNALSKEKAKKQLQYTLLTAGKLHSSNPPVILKYEPPPPLSFRRSARLQSDTRDFEVVEYDDEAILQTDYAKTNTLFVKKGLIKDRNDGKIIGGHFANIMSKFNDLERIDFKDQLFITAIKSNSAEFATIGKSINNRLITELMKTEDARLKVEQELSLLSSDGIVYFEGDHSLEFSKEVLKLAAKQNLLVVKWSSKIHRSFEETKRSIENIKGKKIKGSSLSVFSGLPKNTGELRFQSFDNDLSEMEQFSKRIESKAAQWSSPILTKKDMFLSELKSGQKDVLTIVAHSDGEKMFFGNETISIKELQGFPKCTDRVKGRVGIFCSCQTGNLFVEGKKGKSELESFAEVLIDKGYFDLIVAPPDVINEYEVIDLLDDLENLEILEFGKHMNGNLIGKLTFIAKR